MNRIKQILSPSFFICLALLLHLTCSTAFCGDNSDWRPTYDLVMKWVNFGILVFVIVKYGKAPLMGFLRSQKEVVADEMGVLEKRKAEVTEKIKKTEEILAVSDAHFSELKDKIIKQGEKTKQDIIESARQQSSIMMEMAKKRISNQIIQAKRDFKSEMVNTAIDMASKKLPEQITDKDNDRFVQDYLTSLSAAK
jgi:F-type H+-transporting ATPase subunit b